MGLRVICALKEWLLNIVLKFRFFGLLRNFKVDADQGLLVFAH